VKVVKFFVHCMMEVTRSKPHAGIDVFGGRRGECASVLR